MPQCSFPEICEQSKDVDVDVDVNAPVIGGTSGLRGARNARTLTGITSSEFSAATRYPLPRPRIRRSSVQLKLSESLG